MTDREIEWAQRLAILELKMENVGSDIRSIDQKLDGLLELKQKGVGVFWLSSTLFGTGIVGFVTWFISVLKGH